jgi:hypothetical protein
MTPLTPSRVPLLLETTRVMKLACSAAKIRGRTAFCHGEAPDWVFWRASAKVSSRKFWSIDFGPKFQIFQAIPHEFWHSSLIDLQNIRTQKLTKASENNKAKGLTNENQGVQIHNIWHSSLLSQGCYFIQSLLFSYVLWEVSVNFSRIYFGSLSAVRMT